MIFEGDVVITKEEGVCRVLHDYDNSTYIHGMLLPTDKGLITTPNIQIHISYEDMLSDNEIMKKYAEYCI